MSWPAHVILSPRHRGGAEKRRCKKKKIVDELMNKWVFMERASDMPGHSIREPLRSPRGPLGLQGRLFMCFLYGAFLAHLNSLLDSP